MEPLHRFGKFCAITISSRLSFTSQIWSAMDVFSAVAEVTEMVLVSIEVVSIPGTGACFEDATVRGSSMISIFARVKMVRVETEGMRDES